MRRLIVGAVAALASFLFAGEGQARKLSEIRLYEENDFFNFFTEQTDRYYTQGAKLEWLWSQQDRNASFLPLPDISHADWCSLVCGKDAANGNIEAGYSFGQNMYTPGTITIAAPQPNDRPWAGFLYGSRIARVSYPEESLAAQRQDRIEVTVGIVGPLSFAKETQILWHDIIDDDRPAGWDNQLKTEPVLQLRYDAALRWPPAEGGNADIIPRARVNVGNALASVEMEVTGRVGWNLSGFGVESIIPGVPVADVAKRSQINALRGAGWLASGSLFLRGGIKAVAHNIFLDGNSFASNDIRIRRKVFVPEIAAGFDANVLSGLWLTFQFIHRGSEFETWRGRDAQAQQFGAITIAWKHGK